MPGSSSLASPVARSSRPPRRRELESSSSRDMCSGAACRRRATPLNVAIVGIGGMGGSNARALMSQNIVAICDVDDAYSDKRFEDYKTTLNPPPARAGEAVATPRTPPKLTAAQTAANQRRPATDGMADLRRFMDEQLPKAQRYQDYRRCSTKQKDIDGVVVATPDHMHAIIASSAMDARQARLRAEAAVLVGPGGAAPRAEGEDDQARHPDGQPGPFAGRRAAAATSTSPSGAIGEVTRGPRLDQPAARLLAAGRAAPGAAARTGRPWNGKGVEARLAAALGAGYPGARRTGLGSVPRRRADGRLPPALSPVQLARLGGLGPGRARRHGRAPDRSSVLVARPRVPDDHRDDRDAVQRRLLSERDDDLLRVPGARRASRR